MLKYKKLKKILIVFLISRIPILIIIAYQYINNGIVDILRLYDGTNYLLIAESGYRSTYLFAFFPFYPMLIRIFHYIIPSYTIVGFLISNVSSFLSLVIINSLIKDNNKNKKLYLLCFIFSPILVYGSIIYTESLFIMLTLLSYYLYKENNLYLTAVTIGLAILTRNTGILLFGAIGIDLLIRLYKKDKLISLKTIFLFAFISFSIGCLFPLYLYVMVGDPFYFIKVQGFAWYRKNIFIFQAFLDDVKILNSFHYYFVILWTFIQNWLSYILAIWCGCKLLKKDKVLSLYVFFSILVFSVSFRDINMWKSSLASISMFRYVFGLFPLYLIMLPTNKKVAKITTYLFICISLINYIIVYLGYFIA